ncbi:isoprenylcysteine carboxyl methyltransferase family protein [Oceanobacillus manasiensis]|uniref:isoprenylcysteine carboxyl methyltransferase family protein n=1 Tax=Oceanobacillus manasiensis TaxID=586413 RepID=UPI0005A8147E|nr:isoprenylcysteine carboxylmethyltransferase family protein [Oceanobacillus manasiensis]
MLPGLLWGLFIFLIIQRLLEVYIAKRNERWLKAHGGIERGKEHYKWFIIVHTLFFISLLLEVFIKQEVVHNPAFILVTLFILTQVFRVWCITSLGKFWNTKIIVSPNYPLIKTGPYKYIAHPNYVVVGIELFIIPLMYEAYITSIVFPILHILLLLIRIPAEERVLRETTVSNSWSSQR